MKIGSREFDRTGKTYLMGILNVTPDSFSDGGNYNQLDNALFRAEEMIRQGTDLLDIGGESTRPGYTRLSDEEEICRVVPVIRAVRERFEIPVSVDTYKGNVAEAAVQAGAHMINDIWGFRHDEKIRKVAAESGAACCLMHNRLQPEYRNFLPEVLEDLKESIALARKAGVREDRIMLDPGVGFAKTYEQNLAVIRHLEELQTLGFPVLLAASRKSLIGLTLDLPVDQRLEGTLALTVMAVLKGCSFVRVHDIVENKRVIQMTEAVLAGG